MQRTYDDISEMLDEAVRLIQANHAAQAFIILIKLQGIVQVLHTFEVKWDLIKEDYESGKKPREIAIQYSVKPTQIYDRAKYNNWSSPRKIDKELNKRVKSKQCLFTLDCKQCEQKFTATSGHSKLCGPCSAQVELKEYQTKADKIMKLTQCLSCKSTFKMIDEAIRVCNRCQADYTIDKEAGRA